MSANDCNDAYSLLAPYYDIMMSNRESELELLADLLQQFCISEGTLIELGCGTGQVLMRFKDRFHLTGIDSSTGMLEVARQKLPQAALFHGNIINKLPVKDASVVLCIYDTLNHLLSFSGWERVFYNVRGSLAPDGVFIFDINSLERLFLLSTLGSGRITLPDGYVDMKIDKCAANLFTFQLKICIATQSSIPIALDIQEASFSDFQIESSLKRVFPLVRKLTDNEDKRIAKNRPYYLCSLGNKRMRSLGVSLE